MPSTFRLPAAAAVLNLLCLLAGCTKDQDQPTPELPTLSLSVTEASTWYESIHPSQLATKLASASLQQKTAAPTATLNWSKAFTLSQADQSLVLVPYQGDQALFAHSAVKGVRYLIVAKKATKLDGVTVEVLLKPTAATLDTLTLLTDLYRSYARKVPHMPLAGEGAVLFYNQEYRFLTGHFFTRTGVLSKPIRLAFQPRQKNATRFSRPNSTNFVPEVGKCYDWYTGGGEFITYTGSCDGGGTAPPPPPVYTGGGGPGSQNPNPGSSGSHGPGGWGGNTNPESEYLDSSITFTPAPSPPDVTAYNCSQLRNTHPDDASQQGVTRSLLYFTNRHDGALRDDIIRERGMQNIGPGIKLSMGPNVRYIYDPQNPDIIIDLRHMLVVAYYGPTIGNSVEIIQGLGGNVSAYDHQDYYSNQLGYDFYRNYGDIIFSEPVRFIECLTDFLTKPTNSKGISNRSRNTDPSLVNTRCP